MHSRFHHIAWECHISHLISSWFSWINSDFYESLGFISLFLKQPCQRWIFATWTDQTSHSCTWHLELYHPFQIPAATEVKKIQEYLCKPFRIVGTVLYSQSESWPLKHLKILLQKTPLPQLSAPILWGSKFKLEHLSILVLRK